MTSKCGHCPLADEARDCPGQSNPRACNLPPERLRRSTGPSLARQAVNFVGAVASHVAAGMPTATDEQKNARLAICRACENYLDGSCRLCGCGLETKAGWSDQACPIGKWGPIMKTTT
jgi:hypothetical protein